MTVDNSAPANRCCPPDPFEHASPLTRNLHEFNTAFGMHESAWPTSQVPAEVVALRVKLLKEEFAELLEAIESGDVLAIAKEAADLRYVIAGTDAAFGIDSDAADAEVHRSNMTKLLPDGTVLRNEHGKALKGPNYEPADMAKALGVTRLIEQVL